MSPLISIVITTYNRERYLGAAIDSVLQQTFTDFELLVWDDGSDDRSVAIADGYAQRDARVQVVTAAHRGRVAALQAAIAHTQGAYLGWVDSDDRLAPTALAETVRVLNAQPQVGMVYTDYVDIDEQDKVLRYGERCQIPYSKDRLLLDFMTFHFRLVRRSVFDQVGGINRASDYAEDYDLCLRLSEATEVCRVKQPLYYYRNHAGSASQQWRLEQVLRSQLAIDQALQRRGLADQLAVEVRLPEGRFVLRRKAVPAPAAPAVAQTLIAKMGSLLAALPLLGVMATAPARAQSITSAPDGTNTSVTLNGNRYEIGGGTQAGTNLFQSFQRFGLSANETANFLANPQIQNILGRVVGGEASILNGRLQVTGSNANLFLLNPAGIVFGANASLNVPASFTATTATGIGVGSSWFSATGTNDYATLVGTPGSFAFTIAQPGSIANFGNLAVSSGQTLALLGGTIVSPGTLSAPGGQVVVAAVPGRSLVKLSQPGSLLSLEIQPIVPTQQTVPNAWNLPIASLPQLLTGGNAGNATGVSVNPDGSVVLTGSTTPIVAGNVVVRTVTAETATLSANRNLTLVESQLQTTGDLKLLAGDTVFIRDSVAKPFLAQAGGTLTIQGDRGIDILALNHLQTAPIQSGGDLNLISNGVLSLDSHFTSGNNFSIRSLSGAPASFTSLYDPIITAPGAYTSGAYSGAALKVQAGGDITFTGTITITNADGTATGDPDSGLLTTLPALILRTTAGNITTGDIFTNFSGEGVGSSGPVILSAPGNITTGAIDSSTGGSGFGTPLSGGAVTLTAGSNITTGDINSSYAGGTGYGAQGGNVTLQAGGSIVTGAVNASAIDTSGGENGAGRTGAAFQGGTVSLTAGSVPGSNITFTSIDTRGLSTVASITGSGGNVQVTAVGLVQGTLAGTTIDAEGTNTSGTIALQHDGGPNNLPFTVGSASANGTAGAINRGGSNVITTGSFPVQANTATVVPTTGIALTAVNTPPTLSATNTLLAGASPNTPFTISYASIAPSVGDINQDVTKLIIVSIAPGATLTINGSPVIPGTSTFGPSDVLVYTPPANTIGLLNAFTLRANDGVSTSNPVPVQVNVTVPTVGNACAQPSCSTKPGVQPNGNPLPGFKLSPETPEDRFTQTFESYLGLADTRPKSREEPQQVAQRIEKDTGAKPAFIYISFVPASLDAANGTQTKQLRSNDPADDRSTDQLEILVITAKGDTIRQRIPEATRTKVLTLAQQFRNEVSDPRKTRATTYMGMSRQLYQWLIAPIAADLKAKGIDNLVFLMDAGLRSLPVAALNDGQSFLIEKYSVGVMPSLSLTDTRYRNIRGVKVLGLGISESTQNQPPLPSVPVEVSTLVNDLWSGRLAFNSNVTLANLKAFRKEQPFGIIHLATHADFYPGSLDNSYIQLWDDKLRLDQVRQLGWNDPQIELLVLSACATALGDREAELGFGGLAVQTGVKTAVASLWYVSDAATTALMAGFYKDLRTARIKADALQQAQIAMARGKVFLENGRLKGIEAGEGIPLPPESLAVRDRQFSHPYYWAAFTMIGNPW